MKTKSMICLFQERHSETKVERSETILVSLNVTRKEGET